MRVPEWEGPHSISSGFACFCGLAAMLTFGCHGPQQARSYLLERGVAVKSLPDPISGRRVVSVLEFGDGNLTIKERDWENIHRVGSEIRELYVADAFLSLSDFQHIADLRGLEKLALSSCRMPEGALVCLSECGNLKTLCLSGEGISDSVLADVASIPGLSVLVLEATAITGDGLPAFVACSGLTVNFQNCKRLGQAAIRNLVRLEREATGFNYILVDCSIGTTDIEHQRGVESEDSSDRD